ncbi:hypothetical protein [Nocardia spumae]|uniref:hypothetical protein n=1 Tax=Nocardia spumae TaxID=2887190 RepID=UPI001D15BCBB|nr:hypothetical protein [Nocardia spumae]
MKPRAVGFLHREISGARQEADEHAIRVTAGTAHLDLARTFACSHLVEQPMQRLENILSRVESNTIIVPELRHLDDAAKLNERYRIVVAAHDLGGKPKIWEPHTLMAVAR